MSDPVAVRRMFDASETAFGCVDVLVNNAGIMQLATIADMEDATLDRLIAINLKGTFNTLKEAAKRLRPEGGSSTSLQASSASLSRPMRLMRPPRPPPRR